MRRSTIIAIVVVVLIAVAAIGWRMLNPGPLAFAGGSTVALADYHAADPTGVPADLAQADVVKRGEYLARAADCLICHTVPGGKDYAGGLSFPLPFGTLYSTNITPDKATGIGDYTDQDFLDAMLRGIRRDGARLYPAMPFTSYTYMTDADALAIKAYLFSQPPVNSAAPADTLRFPFNQRWLLGVLVAGIQRKYPLSAEPGAKRRVEQRRLCGRGAGALRRMPYAAQSRLRARQSAKIRRRHHRRLARLRYHLRRRLRHWRVER